MDQNHVSAEACILTVDPKDYAIALEPDIEEIALPHDNYKVYNVGWVDVHVQLLQGLYEQWQTASDETIVKPGKTITFDNVGNVFRVSGVKISNKNDSSRAVIYCRHTDCSFRETVLTKPRECDKLYSDNLKKTYSISVKFIPYVSKKFRGLYETYWPSNGLNLWEQILLKLQPLLSSDVFGTTSTIVNKFTKNFQRKLYALSRDFDAGLSVFDMYMDIAADLDEFDIHFINPCDDNFSTTNMLLLPLFSNFVLLKTTFYTLGIINFSQMRFTHKDISSIENRLKSTKKANQYINNILEDCLHHAYNHSHLNNLFNSMTDVRSCVAIHGTEFIRIWDSMVRSPFSNKIFNDVISYSNFFGRPTPNLTREATAKKMFPPLTPSYIGFIYNYLTSIDVYLWSDLNSEKPKIGGMKLTFADHSSYVMGTKTELTEKIDFMKAYIVKLEVTGSNAVDSCTFHMSDGRKLFFGTRETRCEEMTFELKDHRIVSLFLSSDDESLARQAANIAVSYRLNSIWE